MGHDSVPTVSPAKWRAASPSSPTFSGLRKSGVHSRDDSFEKPDLGWKALLKRHQFLLFMLAILTFLCTIYLYFAITFATVDTCSNLQGKLKAHCYQLQGKSGKAHSHHRRRLLVMQPTEVPSYDVIHQGPFDECGPEYENYLPCKNGSTLSGTCRQRTERPPLCKVPVPSGYHRPGPWQGALRTADGETNLLPYKVLNLGCGGCSNVSSVLMAKSDASTMWILGSKNEDSFIRDVLDEGFPAMVMTLFDEQRFPAHSYDLIRSDGCGDKWQLSDASKYFLEVNRLLRPKGHFVWSLTGSGVLDENEELSKMMKLHWAFITRVDDSYVWRKSGLDEKPVQVNGFTGGQASRSLMQGGHKMQESQNMEEIPIRDYHATLRQLYYASTALWVPKVCRYMELLGTDLLQQVRNVMDMNAELGSFAAILSHLHPIWTMNVVPKSEPEMLEAIYHRGLLGAKHNWCEAFPTPARSYDLVHSSGTFSKLERCNSVDVIIEVDRILRPGGLIIVRDALNTITEIKRLSVAVRWRLLFEYDGGSKQCESVLIMLKDADFR